MSFFILKGRDCYDFLFYVRRGIKYSSYKLKYSNEETETISFEDSDGNRHSISAFIGFNSKFR